MGFRRVPGQRADDVLEGSGANSRHGSGGFWCRLMADEVLMRFWRVPAQIARKAPAQIARKVPAGSGADGQMTDEVLEGSGADSKVPMQMADEVSNGLVQTKLWRDPDG